MDELRTTLNTVLDTVEKELAAARDMEPVLLAVSKERDELRVENRHLQVENGNLKNEYFGTFAVHPGIVFWWTAAWVLVTLVTFVAVRFALK